MITAAQHIAKARHHLASGHHAMTGGFTDAGGRDAYLAAFQAALAFIVSCTGKEPKTHGGTRSEFARVVRGDARIEQRFVTFLASAYRLKTWADYDGDEPTSTEDASAALVLAGEMVDVIERLLASQ